MITFNLHQCHLDKQSVESVGYGIDTAKVVADHDCAITAVMLEQDAATNGGCVLVNTFSLNEGLQQFGERASGAANNGTKQLRERMGSAPDDMHGLKAGERSILSKTA